MGALDLYWFELDVAAGRLAGWRAWLSPEERTRADRFLTPQHGQRYLAAHAQLRWLLAGRLGCAPGEVTFERVGQGKPQVPGHRLRFNLSHSAGWGVVGIHPELEVGVDIEAERPGLDQMGLSRRFFTPEETDWLQSLSVEQRQRGFARLWACKEAWLKAGGHGVAQSLHRVEVSLAFDAARLRVLDAPFETWWVRELELVPGYASAVVLPQAPDEVRVQRLAPPA